MMCRKEAFRISMAEDEGRIYDNEKSLALLYQLSVDRSIGIARLGHGMGTYPAVAVMY